MSFDQVRKFPFYDLAKLRQADARRHTTAATTPEVDELLSHNCVVAIAISGGKDSDACALATAKHLDAIGHTGPRVLIHSDLGSIEWKDSLPSCERLAKRLGYELIVIRPKSGGLVERWQKRWTANVKRYSNLECVKLILPWSTPSMRFCTSEKKTSEIVRELRKRYPTQDILNVTGVRRQESANRSTTPISENMPTLARKGALGHTWNAIAHWLIEDVFQEIFDAGLELHEAYTKYMASRVSCVVCIMSTAADLKAATTCEDNIPVYRVLVELEATSGFGFQGSRWLADVAPHLLSADLLERVARAKEGAKRRVALEAKLPKHLHFKKGWPEVMPTPAEAELIAEVRRGVADAVGLEVGYTTAEAVLARYAELMAKKALDAAKKSAAAEKKAAAKAKKAAKAVASELTIA